MMYLGKVVALFIYIEDAVFLCATQAKWLAERSRLRNNKLNPLILNKKTNNKWLANYAPVSRLKQK